MAYIKNTWVDQNVERPRTYELQNNTDGSVTFIDSFGNVTELGTPVNADNMNHIEEGIYAGSFTKYDANGVYEMNDLITVIEDGSPVIYKSLQDNNEGNALSDTTYWEKISLGGGGGLEIGDIGIAPLGIDETKGKRRYLNGQLIIQEQYVQFANKVKSAVALYPTLACTESEWQATALLTVGGQVGKFVVDDNAGTIRLPKIIMPIQGLTNLSKLGEIVEAGLPNITGTWFSDGTDGGFSTTGAIQINSTRSDNGAGHSGNKTTPIFGLDASLSSAIYGNSNTVQQEQIQYPYFIQVATGAETEDNIINEIELNNPFSLLDYKFSEYELNNISWLRSEGQYNSKAIYPAVYDLLLKIYNGTETKAGVSVKLATETFTDYDFVLNTAEETFRLPLKTLDDFVVESYREGTDWYRVYKSGWLEQGSITGNIAQSGGSTINLLKPFIDTNYHIQGNTIAGQVYTTDGFAVMERTTTTFTCDWANAKAGDKSYWFACGQGAETPQGKMYFYVGETVQNANLINAGRIQEKVAEAITRMDCKAYITETYKNGTSWYRIYSDGWCEQGGRITVKSDSQGTITLLKSFYDILYSVFMTNKSTITTTNETKVGPIWVNTQAVNSFTYTNDTWEGEVIWEAKGYIV